MHKTSKTKQDPLSFSIYTWQADTVLQMISRAAVSELNTQGQKLKLSMHDRQSAQGPNVSFLNANTHLVDRN